MSGLIYLSGSNISIARNVISVSSNPVFTGTSTFSTISATTLSAGTIYSAGTNLYNIFSVVGASGATNTFTFSATTYGSGYYPGTQMGDPSSFTIPQSTITIEQITGYISGVTNLTNGLLIHLFSAPVGNVNNYRNSFYFTLQGEDLPNYLGYLYLPDSLWINSGRGQQLVLNTTNVNQLYKGASNTLYYICEYSETSGTDYAKYAPGTAPVITLFYT